MERPDRFEEKETKEDGGVMDLLNGVWEKLTGKNKETDLDATERLKSQNELATMRKKLDGRNIG